MKIQNVYLLLVGLSLFLASPGFGQDIGQRRYTIEYARLPYFQLPESIRTYQQKISLNKYVAQLFKETGLENAIKSDLKGYLALDGYEISETDPDLYIIVTLATSKPLTSKLKVFNNSYSLNTADGTVQKVPYSSFCYEMDYGVATLQLQIKTRQGVFLERTIEAPLLNTVFGSQGYNTRYRSQEALKAGWEKEKLGFLQRLAGRLFATLPNEVSDVLGEYCLRKMHHQLMLEYVSLPEKNTNHTYGDLDQANQLLIEALEGLKKDSIVPTNRLIKTDRGPIRAKIQEAIQIWEGLLAQVDPKDNKARINKKIARILYFNLAKAYLWIEDYPKAQEYLQLRRDNKGVGGEAKLNAFEKFLRSQELRARQNEWRLADEANPLLAEEFKKGLKGKPANFAEPAYIYIAVDGKGVGTDDYTVLLNNQPIGATISAGGTMIYEVYSEGFLQIALAKINPNGSFYKLGGVLDRLKQLPKAFLDELAYIADTTTFITVTLGVTEVRETEEEIEYDVQVTPHTFTLGDLIRPQADKNSPQRIFKTPPTTDITYRNFDKSEQYLDLRPGGHYYFRISVIDKAIRKKEELDGEVEFYRRYENPIELEEDAYLPIPNMSIFNYDLSNPKKN
ncbi:MAG: hypothetical protein OHK0053_17950 [Microscillaceae bacterium]